MIPALGHFIGGLAPVYSKSGLVIWIHGSSGP